MPGDFFDFIKEYGPWSISFVLAIFAFGNLLLCVNHRVRAAEKYAATLNQLYKESIEAMRDVNSSLEKNVTMVKAVLEERERHR